MTPLTPPLTNELGVKCNSQTNSLVSHKSAGGKGRAQGPAQALQEVVSSIDNLEQFQAQGLQPGKATMRR